MPRRPILAALVLLAFASSAAAQTSCEDARREAQKTFDLGLFDDVRQQLAPCLNTRTTKKVAVEVHSLLARAELNAENAAGARKEISIILGLDPTFDAGSAGAFATLVAQVRREELTTLVGSVSKTNESLREAPATVVIVTGEEIQRRGYLDLEQLLHDLPGFDVARANVSTYAWIEQRGYTSTNNDRLIFLVDGVEQGDLTTNVLYLSRQFPLSNIERVEIVYGPASTMYGANAYTGVISILTKQAEALVDEKKALALRGQVTGGERWGMVDVTAAGRDRAGTFSWSVAASVQSSREPDLTNLPLWDFSYNNIDYKSAMRLPGTPSERAALCAKPSPYIRCSGAGIELTDAGASLMRSLDAALIADNNLGFDDRAKNWGFNGVLRVSNLTLGAQAWRSYETASSEAPATFESGNSTWTPRFTSLYLKYSVPLDRLKVNVFSRFIETSVERANSHYKILHNYSGGWLSLWSLVAPCVAPSDEQPVSCAPARPWIEDVKYGLLSTQSRNEINVTYESPGKWNAVAGAEYARSSIQAGYAQEVTGPGYPYLYENFQPEQLEHTDTAIFGQASYRPRPAWKLLLAGRLSHNDISNKAGATGFGTLFTPRASVIYSALKNALTLKAIYSEAFKDPTDQQKFGLLRAGEQQTLKPEFVKNLELSAGWQSGKHLALEASAYRARYSDVVECIIDPVCPDCGCAQFVNSNSIDVTGLQLTGRYERGRWRTWGNYTNVRPYAIDPVSDYGTPLLDDDGNRVRRKRLTYIAPYRANAGVDVDWTSRIRSSFRAHYSSRYEGGLGETVDHEAGADAVVSYHHERSNATLQLIVQNVFDGTDFAPSPQGNIPQKGRAVYLRLVYGR